MTKTARLQLSQRLGPAEELGPGDALAHATGRQDGVPDLRRALLRYWIELPRRSLADRAAALDSIARQVRHGELARQALVPFALGDCEHVIVATAVKHYVGGGPLSIERRDQLSSAALEWVRRGLALNRTAVFTALVETGDEGILERLNALRLLLDDVEARTVQSHFATDCRPQIAAFIADWIALAG